jgi:uncharacterized protein (TIGR00369 family)
MYTPVEADYVSMVRKKIEGNSFMHDLGIKITSIEPGAVLAELAIAPRHLQQAGFVHGGVTASMADIVAGFSAVTLVSKEQGMVTVDLRVSYLNPAKSDLLFAKGFVIKAGQKLIFTEAEIWTMSGATKLMVAKASATMAIVNPTDIRK